jgi:hypothetical protein
MEITIKSKSFDAQSGVWWISFEAKDETGTRSGTQSIELPATATDDQFITAILVAFSYLIGNVHQPT